ncbi:MAG TPA: NfeD family protein [Opitutaceae bacterium]|nr:NfeD family protein [Opitutaceae bacterium]
MTIILLLFIVGIMLLAADVFVSSFIMAAVGGVALLAGCVIAYRDFGVLAAGLAAFAAVALLGGAIYVELVLLPRTRLGRGLVVESTSGSSSQPPVAPSAAVVGRPATADTTLAPSGYVLVDGRRYEAFCRTGHVARGEALRVVGMDNFRLIVSKT